MKLFTFLLAAAAISADSLTAQLYDCPCDQNGGGGGIFYQWIYGPADRRYNARRARILAEWEKEKEQLSAEHDKRWAIECARREAESKKHIQEQQQKLDALVAKYKADLEARKYGAK